MSDDAASLAPVLLVSMPQMVDPNFSRSVILLAEYGANGAFGLIVNRQMAEPAMEVVRAEPPLAIRPDVHLFVGGPVEPTRAWVLLADKNLDGDAMEVSDGVYLSASPELIRHTLSSAPDPAVRIVVGYAGWAARAARRGTGRVVVADGAGAARPDFRDAARVDVGDGDPPPRRRTLRAAGEFRGPLTHNTLELTIPSAQTPGRLRQFPADQPTVRTTTEVS